MTCTAHIRPFSSGIILDCEIEPPHNRHQGTIRDYAYPGSATVVTWFDEDRRNFHGEYPGPCTTMGCTLPNHHSRGCNFE